MSTRVWRQLAAETPPQAQRDTVLRLALASMAADPTSPLTAPQRQWIIALAQRTTPFTPEERLRLREPLVVWIKDKMPRCLDIIEKAFVQDT